MKKEMKSNIKHIITRIILVIFSLTIISCRQSSDHIADPGTETGPVSVKINLQGSDYNDGGTSKTAGINGINSAAVQTEEISFNNNNDYKLVATLSPETSSNPRGKAGITGTNPLPNGIRYRVAVFDSNGNYITEQTYFTGSESSFPAITGLNGGSTYTFIVYSIGTQTGLPAITFVDPGNKTLATATVNNVSGDNDLMYFSKTMTLTGNNTNYLDVVLQHKYSQITVTLDASPTQIYSIINVNNVNVTPHYSSATLNLSDGTVTRTTSSSREIAFSGSGKVLTADPMFFNTDATTSGVLSINSITLQAYLVQVIHQNIKFNNLKITPGVKYNLKLSFVPNDQYLTYKGYPAARINGVIFMRHNLGANTSANADIPSQNIVGNYYQWGIKNPVANVTTGTGPITGWNNTIEPIAYAWNTGTEAIPVKNTANDPCPTGWRVTTFREYSILFDSTNYTSIGSSVTTNPGSAAGVFTSKFNSGVKLTFPYAGLRNGTDGSFSINGNISSNIEGDYWTANGNVDDSGIVHPAFRLFDINGTSGWVSNGSHRFRGMPIRCVAEYPY
ncbi:hypothetical protein [Elizabethkingia anophelis]|uniref:Fibrobacter succinogenes major paralogous domain-containing protein n=1 Tax=Elizabethkingia anophelis TaxID=1117645 RepID=A0AAU8UT63_9FLAO|nr:hypothetical protein [Elizabethkingia anophelis]AQX00167.1 hypothetical protein BBD32_01150 [Elizabethkingia anophelis]MCT4287134.1 hypothetical protein [Elizabethkingia anophelis]MDV3566439.1 hypothetical protein [Elizabethkingia anophelis]MDV3874421.1 hypothetical protein [Elizabethkingia anophelis]MDV3970854.1 hypothetical protein [Elizabethkingia anophelis]